MNFYITDDVFYSDKPICFFTGKKCYSKKEAGSIANQCKKHNSNVYGRRRNLPRRSYFCRYCGCYHLTHQPFIKKGDILGKNKFYEADAS